MNSIYLKAAIETANYLDTFIRHTDHGLYWDIEKSFNGKWRYYDKRSMYAGSSGIIKFYLELYEVTDNQKYYDTVIAAGQYLIEEFKKGNENLDKAFSRYAFTTGIGGVAFILDELYDYTQKQVYYETVQCILNNIVVDQNEDGYWSGETGIVADSGTALLLIKLGRKYKVNSIEKVLTKYGNYILENKKKDANDQEYYIGLNLKYVGGPNDKFNTGFPLGPAGVAYTLLSIWNYTGNDKYLSGTKGIKEFYEYYSIDKTGILLPHYLPDTEHICYVGYCGGPVGIARYFYEYYFLTKDVNYLELFKKTIESLVDTGAPFKRSEGYWQTDNYCCGTAGILHLFISAYKVTKDHYYLELAKKTGNILLNRADKENGKIYWKQAFERTNPTNITVPLGYYDGAAGIAAELLRLDQAIIDKFNRMHLIDDPY